MSTQRRLLLMGLLSLVAVGFVTSPAAAYSGALTFIIENDWFTGSDNNYTNGAGISWVSADLANYDNHGFLNKWGRLWSFLPFVSDDGYATHVAWSVAQEMHTSGDISVPNPPLDDQPYAGVLYVDNLFYARRQRWAHVWEIKLGVVGPSSQAGDVQTRVHKIVGAGKPMGWDTQLPDELVANVGYSVARLACAGDMGGLGQWKLVPMATAGLGSYFTGAGLGLYGEFGWNLVEAFGGPALRTGFNSASTAGVGPVDGWSASFFGGIGGFGIAHYLPLDGTLFKDSRSVDTNPFVGMGSYGIAVRHGSFVMNLAYTHLTQTFKTERNHQDFGVMSLSLYR